MQINKGFTEEELIDIYKSRLKGEIARFPAMFKGNKHYFKTIGVYLFEEVLGYDMQDIYDNVTDKMLIKYKIGGSVSNYFKSNYEFIKYIYPERGVKPWLFKLGARHYTEDDEIVKDAISIFIDKYQITEDDIYSGIVKVKTLQEEKLFSIFHQRFSGSVFQMFEWYYSTVLGKQLDYSRYAYKSKYWDKNRVNEAVRRLFTEQGFNEEDDGLENRSLIVKLFNQYELDKVCSTTVWLRYYDSMYDMFCGAFPNYDIYAWEFNYVSVDYWENNRNTALKQLMTRLKINKEDLNKYLNFQYIGKIFPKINGVCCEFYHSDYFLWVDDVFPNLFTKEEFHNKRIYHDGYRMHSSHEVYIHDILTECLPHVEYIESKKRNWFHNENCNESYCPDWMCGNVIIEYFGWYYPKSSSTRMIEYTEKANRKIAFYNELEGYDTIYLYPDDMSLSKEDLIDKVMREYNALTSKGFKLG